MRTYVLLVVVVMAAYLSGCASTAKNSVKPTLTELRQAKSFQPSSGRAGLYIYKIKSAGLVAAQVLAPHIYWYSNKFPSMAMVDDVEVGEVDINSYYYLELLPGKHTIQVDPASDPTEIQMKPDKNYFVESVEETFGKKTRRVDEETAKKQLADVKLLGIPPSIKSDFNPQNQPAQVVVSAQSQISKQVKVPEERLVLMPLRLSDEDKNLQGAMVTALVQGLSSNFIVFSGEQVEQKARQIFMKESQTAHKQCDETRCMQGIAEAFQAELIATANVSKQDGGYFLALSIQNIFDNKIVFSNSVPCESCTSFQVVNKLKELSNQ